MGKNWVSFRLSDECMTVLQRHQAALSTDAHEEVDRTAALEAIILKFENQSTRPIARLKKLLQREPSFEKGDRPLEMFLTAPTA